MAISRANPGFGTKVYFSDGGSTNGVKASKTIGLTDQQVLYTAKTGGTGGNTLQVAHLNGGNSQSLAVNVAGSVINVSLATDGSGVVTSTASDVVDAVNQHASASLLVLATNGVGNGSGLAIAAAAAALSGGTNGAVTWSELGEITDVPGIGASHRTDEVTHMSSPNGWAEHIGLGVKEQKAFTLALNFVADDTQQILLYQTRIASGDKNTYKIVFTDELATGLVFDAIVSDTDMGHPRDGKADASYQFQPTGEPTWTTGGL